MEEESLSATEVFHNGWLSYFWYAPVFRSLSPSIIFSNLIFNNLFYSFFQRMYERVWDEADYVVPPAENGAFFVTTNVVITPNQTLGHSPEVRKSIPLLTSTPLL